MKGKAMNVFRSNPPWWHFWNPMSGPVGGLVCGLFVVLLCLPGVFSGRVNCTCKGNCQCCGGCDGQCSASGSVAAGCCDSGKIMRAGGVITMYADPIAKECGEYGVFARVEAIGADGEPRTVAISLKPTASEAMSDAARQMGLSQQQHPR